MTLKDINLKKCYDSDEDDILNEFYIPALSNSIKYDRLAGYFSSQSLAVAAKGIDRFIENGGKMRIVSGAQLSKEDVNAIKKAKTTPESIVGNSIIEALENLKSEFVKKHVRALAWMVANNMLEIKVAIPKDEEGTVLSYKEAERRGIFHQKIGIFEDDQQNTLSFSGSENETANAWKFNIEEFKVFKNWKKCEKDYVNADKKRFEKFWENSSKKCITLEIPEAAEKKLIEISKNSSIEEINLKKWYEKTNKTGKSIMKKQNKEKQIELWPIQKEALNSWIEDGYKGIFAMATGTGKTYTALGCLNNVLKQQERLIIVIATPRQVLNSQWEKSVDRYGIFDNFDLKKITADGTNPNWKNELYDLVQEINIRYRDYLLIFTTHHTFASEDFIKRITKSDYPLFLIVDEVHGVGTERRQRGLLGDYEFRLGLSATPERHYNESQTEELLDFFEGISFKFSLEEAINKKNKATGQSYLTPYVYKPHFVELTDEELVRYKEETEKIRNIFYNSDDKEEREKLLTILTNKRASIVKTARAKYDKLKQILDGINEIKFTLIYCSSTNPEQIERTKEILEEKGIIWHQITQAEGTKNSHNFNGQSERDHLLSEFQRGELEVLVSMKILDEGIDVKEAKRAIMLSNSANPRQYIQRRGRVLRRSEGKSKSIIHDIIVLPYLDPHESQIDDIERKLLKKELERYTEFAEIAENDIECLKKIDNIRNKYRLNS